VSREAISILLYRIDAILKIGEPRRQSTEWSKPETLISISEGQDVDTGDQVFPGEVDQTVLSTRKR
jgi:hypothetical protein